MLPSHVLLEINNNHGHAHANVVVECDSEEDVNEELAEVDLALLLENDARVDEWEVFLVLANKLELFIEHLGLDNALLRYLLR